MLSAGLVLASGLLWLGLLFGTALWAERRPGLLARHWGSVYALSLAVYCTSWTFYGTVTQAARSGWALPPTFVGTIALYALGFGLVARLVQVSRESGASSVADLVATRLGKDSWLAAAVTFVALAGLVPYIALQLKAVAMSFGLLTRGAVVDAPAWQDGALYVALAMAVFAMLFGTRSASAAEHNRGLVLAMAAESLLKLGAMLAIGAWLLWHGDLVPAAPPPPPADGASGFPALVLLGVLAMFTLPHQFHVGAVECRDPAHLRTARWMFPLYMVLIALPILPLAQAGDARLAPVGVPSDLYVLALPLAEGQGALALLAFLGGLSAATGMVVLATLALSLMLGQHWLAPLMLRAGWAQGRADGRAEPAPGDLGRSVLRQRRIMILAVVLLAWGWNRVAGGSDALADLGALSFSALATLAPAVYFAVWRPRTPPRAVLLGLAAGFATWCWALLVPTLAGLLEQPPGWIEAGPFGQRWLAPDALLGLGDWSRIGRAVALSLVVGVLATLLAEGGFGVRERVPGEALTEASLRDVAARFLPPERMAALFAPRAGGTGEAGAAGREARVERALAAVLGAASARLLLDAARREQGRDLEAVAAIVGEASQALRFNQRVLEAALENMSQGISVVDRELRLVAWNRRYAELFGFPDALLQVNTPIADLARWALERGHAGERDDGAGRDPVAIAAMVERRLAHMRDGSPHLTERRFPDGTIVEIRGNPMPGGGFVATFTDVTAFRQAEAGLLAANETLEQRVAARTAELAAAKAAAERANDAKSRFLAAVGHDLLQPLHAAHLFTHALGERLAHAEYRDSVRSIEGALASTEQLLAGLLDISRLDAGRLEPKPRAFALSELLEPLASEFGALAAERGLALEVRPTRAWVLSDPQLLRRVLQNFLSNAVRYTERGRVLLGVRRVGGALRVEVWDTGPGIAEAERAALFEEFRRGGRARGQGLGLGLSIADRFARLLGHPLHLRSWPGRGSVFSITLPRAAAGAPARGPRAAADASGQAALAISGRVLLVDNDAEVLAGMRQLLTGWGFAVDAARDAGEALAAAARARPDVVLLDFHLDDGATGLAAHAALVAAHGPLPAAVITADHGEQVRHAVLAAGLVLLHKPIKPLALKSVLARLR